MQNGFVNRMNSCLNTVLTETHEHTAHTHTRSKKISPLHTIILLQTPYHTVQNKKIFHTNMTRLLMIFTHFENNFKRGQLQRNIPWGYLAKIQLKINQMKLSIGKKLPTRRPWNEQLIFVNVLCIRVLGFGLFQELNVDNWSSLLMAYFDRDI